MSDQPFGFHEDIPESIRGIFMWLCQDVARLALKWDCYTELFATKESIDLLSDLAPAFFQIIEESLREDMTMAICRLSDPSQTGEWENLSMETLFERLDEHARPDKMLHDFHKACAPVRTLRNKRVGHSDLGGRVQPQSNVLPGIARGQIDQIVEQAEGLLNRVYEFYVHSRLVFKPMRIGGADAVLFWLRKGWVSELNRKVKTRERELTLVPAAANNAVGRRLASSARQRLSVPVARSETRQL
jgi:hypothetical protein